MLMIFLYYWIIIPVPLSAPSDRVTHKPQRPVLSHTRSGPTRTSTGGPNPDENNFPFKVGLGRFKSWFFHHFLQVTQQQHREYHDDPTLKKQQSLPHWDGTLVDQAALSKSVNDIHWSMMKFYVWCINRKDGWGWTSVLFHAFVDLGT